MNKNIHLCTANVKGLRDKEKRLRLYEWINNQKCNIMFIQESHFDKEIEESIKLETNSKIYYSHGSKASRGVATFIDSRLEFDLLDFHKDTEGRILLLNVEIENIIYSLVNIYAPNYETDRKNFYKKLNDFINENAMGIVILGGDTNDALTNNDRKILNNNKKKIKPVGSLKTLIQSNDLIDIWRYKNKTDIQFTWRRKNPDQASRIDMFLINKDFLMNIKSCDIRPILIKFTDHQAVSLKIETVTMKSKGPGYWKINNSILQEEKYVKNINRIIQKYSFKINEDKNRMDLWWDYMKIEIKHYSIKYCKAKAIDRKNELNKLEKELRALSSLQDTVKDNKEIIEKINVIENKIEKIYEYKAKGTQIRARQDWIEKGEKNNAYFLGLEKSNQTKKTILKLKNDKGQIVTDQAEIIKVEKLFYEKLYSKNIKLNQNTRDYLKKIPLAN